MAFCFTVGTHGMPTLQLVWKHSDGVRPRLTLVQTLPLRWRATKALRPSVIIVSTSGKVPRATAKPVFFYQVETGLRIV
jgi:hypothetical protein